jgi:hypothetical protein
MYCNGATTLVRALSTGLDAVIKRRACLPFSGKDNPIANLRQHTANVGGKFRFALQKCRSRSAQLAAIMNERGKSRGRQSRACLKRMFAFSSTKTTGFNSGEKLVASHNAP